MFRAQAARLRSRPMVYSKQDRHWRPLTWSQMERRVAHAAAGLVQLGIRPTERVAIYSESGAEWVLADLAILSAGGVTAPIYETLSGDQVVYILRDSESRVLFINNREQLDRLLKFQYDLPKCLTYVIHFDEELYPPVVEGLQFMSLLELESLGRTGDLGEVDRRVARIEGDDLLTLIYTSGTTGVPKGVMISHNNMISNCEATSWAIPVTSDDVVLSFLPLSHAFERTATYYTASLFSGATVYFAEGAGRLFQNLRQVNPTLLTGVPRVFEKIYMQFKATRERAPLLQRKGMDWALHIGRKVSVLRQQGRAPGRLLAAQYKIAHDQLFAQIHERLGGNIRLLISGGAALSVEVAEFFHAVGLLILEGYGLSETAPVLCVNRPDAYRFGTVGLPLDNVELRLAPDGEILARGPNVMQGYFNLPEETAEVFTEDGWFKTGDIGRFIDGGFLKITDRKKDLFKTAGGKYIAPQRLERLLNQSAYIKQVCVIGDNRPYCVALIVPDFEALQIWATEEGLNHRGPSELVRSPAIHKLLQDEIAEINAQLSRHETIKAFHPLIDAFTLENHQLTPTLKVRRRAVMAAYAAEIETLYTRAARVGWRR
ncbi:long-chain fatty acid--CoA ligase [Myxococcota bacterium]|nr:long-chain fatty acid--CoA ligase [Myxococcota bacterium]